MGEEEENERRLEAAATKVLERQKRLEGGTDASLEEEEENLVKKEKEETLESVRRQMEMVLVEGEAEMPETEAVADIVAAEYVKQLAICPSTNHKTETLVENSEMGSSVNEPSSEAEKVEGKESMAPILASTEAPSQQNLEQPYL